MMSELLDLPCLTFARKVDAGDGSVTVERQTAAGYDVVTAPLPALLSVTSGILEPRYPTFKGIMQAKSKPIDTTTAADLGVEVVSDQRIVSVDEVAARAAGEVVEDEGDAFERIVSVLEETKVI